MSKYIKYDKAASALELAKVYKEARIRRLKMVHELQFIFGAELTALNDLIRQKLTELELLSEIATQTRENADETDTLLYIN